MLSNKDFKNNSMSNFFSLLQDRKLIVFGASDAIIKDILPGYDLDISYFVDNNKAKEGATVNINGKKIEIKNPSVLMEEDKNNIVVFIASVFFQEIAQQLHQMDITESYFSHTLFKRRFYVSKEIDNNLLLNNKENINELYSAVSDNKSKEVLDRLLESRKYGYMQFRDIADTHQYFVPDIISFGDDEVYIDAGALDGQTTIDFLHAANNKYVKIIAFEPDPTCYLKCKTLFSLIPNAEIHNLAVFDKESIVKFNNLGHGSSAISEAGGIDVKTARIDSIVNERVTFIKMDIEGAEIEALTGASEIIKRYKPKLAICIYHKFEHLWEIPFYIKSLVPEYKLYIRHHNASDRNETVLYATV